MNQADREAAETVLTRLCKGAQIDGIRFGPVLQILIANHGSKGAHISGQVYLNLGTRWMVVDHLPREMPKREEGFPALSVTDQIAAIGDLREHRITSIRLGEIIPHLIIALASGRHIIINGHHDEFEPWQVGVAYGNRSEPWMVVACPGDQVAIWSPETNEVNARLEG